MAMTNAASPDLDVEVINKFLPGELESLCDITTEAIKSGGGFGWVKPPEMDVLERFWKGVLVVPERSLFIARLDGSVAGTAQLIRQPRNNEAQYFSGIVTTAFVAPWARGYGLARLLISKLESYARQQDVKVLNLDVRETQHAAIQLYENMGFHKWGEHPHYAEVDGKIIKGLFYCKTIA